MPAILSGGYVYVVRNTAGEYKIGRTIDMSARLSQLNGEHRETLQVVHVMTCDDAVHAERYIHRHFGSKRIGGEWFRLDAEDVADLKAIDHVADGLFPEDYDDRMITLSCQIPEALNRLIERHVIEVNKGKKRWQEKYRKQDAIREAFELFLSTRLSADASNT